MIFGIDASNINRGGGLTHLREILGAADSFVGGDEVIVWAANATLNILPTKKWLNKKSHSFLNKSLLHRFIWQKKYFNDSLRSSSCDVLFIPGANYSGSFSPYVSMSQNMLPFEKKERFRFFPSLTHLRYLILNVTQSRSFKNANGLIFLTKYAQNVIGQQLSFNEVPYAIVPHGISNVFSEQEKMREHTKRFNWLYVSIINYYKHQDVLSLAACELKKEGYDLSVTLIGPSFPKALAKLNQLLEEIDPTREIVNYGGSVAYEDLPSVYSNANGFIFPSSCENLPNILLEAMSSKIPIASSDRGPMPEVLQDGGIYFDPESVESTKAVMKNIMDDKNLSHKLSERAYLLSQEFTWQRCAKDTFSFLRKIAQN